MQKRQGGVRWLHTSSLGMRLQMLSFTKMSEPGRETRSMEGKELSFGCVRVEKPAKQSTEV